MAVYYDPNYIEPTIEVPICMIILAVGMIVFAVWCSYRESKYKERKIK